MLEAYSMTLSKEDCKLYAKYLGDLHLLLTGKSPISRPLESVHSS